MCMDHSYFQFLDSFYHVSIGTNMGNPLSPLISELFMSAFERKLKQENLLPRIWWRYVDDVFAIIKKDEIDSVLNVLNNRFDSIKFTCEKENDKCKLSFLDIELSTSVDNKIDIAIYHKPTDTLRTITSDSNCSMQHKLAAYHSMVHRLCRMKLSAQNYMTEYARIKQMAKINGFKGDLVDVLIKKHLDKINKFNLSTLFSQNTPEVERVRVGLPYIPQIMKKIKNKFREYNLTIVYTNQTKIMNLLGSTKDTIDSLHKSGIYAIQCPVCMCEYIGQTKRNISVRFREHCLCIKNKQGYRSALAFITCIEQRSFEYRHKQLTAGERDRRRAQIRRIRKLLYSEEQQRIESG
ncbi:uncharacterized protein LOC129572701 [Sitodiplosis mosellana]|uniref:uncharacterized protein LOC129572701 n=1 Tax=Sitodiplosis mosellana TaxID=263140 RepID=UPI002443C21D|nr:uncharacterized protein LOC129572701 [Sitodiplosis mosellana]